MKSPVLHPRSLRSILRMRRLRRLALLPLAGITAVVQGAVAWTTNQPAETQVGTGKTEATSASFLSDAVAIDAAHKTFYVADRMNHRVLRFAYPASANQPSADVVFGQADFTANAKNRGGNAGAATMATPYGLAVAANGDLWVADYDNNRILKFAAAYAAASSPNANIVLGQSSFTATTPSTGANRLANPTALSIDASDNLWVADMGNSRVLRFAAVSSATTGASAAQVFGQPSFSGGQSNRGGAASSYTLSCPYGVCAVGSSLWIADTQNNRVLRFNNATSKGNGGAADAVLGQPHFLSTSANGGGSATLATVSFPSGLAVDDSGSLLLSDSFNNRLLVFANAATFVNGSAATNSIVTSTPWGLAYDSTYHRLLAACPGSNFVLQFANCASTDVALTSSANPSFPNTSITVKATVTSAGGTPTGSVRFTEGATVLGTSTLNASGIATFTTAPLTEGSHNIVARYLGDANHQCSSSPWLTQTVARFAPGIDFHSSANPAKEAQSVTFTATLSAPAGQTTVPTGTVIINVDGSNKATITLGASGIATWSTASLEAGSHTIKATYSGDTLYRELFSAFVQYVETPGILSFPAVANVEHDVKGTTEVVYNGAEYGGAVYAGDYDSYKMWAAYRFDLTAGPTSFAKAVLKVRIANTSDPAESVPIELHGSESDNWSDTSTPPTAPTSMLATPLVTRNSSAMPADSWQVFEVTDFVRTQMAGDKKVTFVLTAPTAPAGWCVGFGAKELVEYAPVLELTEAMYSDWAGAHFTAAELANPAIGGANADPDGAGITNLVRYACGLPARGPVAAPGTATVNTATNPATTTFTFPMCAVAADLSYAVQTSTDLATWTTAATYTTNGAARSVSTPVSAPVGAARFFIRLKISAVP